jgi:predicted DNA-binding protein
MSTEGTLTENVRVRMTPSTREELRQAAKREQRTPGFIARRAIERELERLRSSSKREA